jgi:teichuronic acid exporter
MNHQDSLRQQIQAGASWSVAGNGSHNVLNAIFTIILVRYLSPYDFGIVATALLFFLLLKALFYRGIGSVIIQKKDIKPEHSNSLFWMSALLGIGIMLAVILSTQMLKLFFGQSDLLLVFQALSPLALVFSLGCIPRAMILRNLHIKTISHALIIGASISGICAIILAASGFGIWSLVVQQLVLSLVTLTIFWRSCHWKPRLQLSRMHIRELTPFMLIESGNVCVLIFAYRIDQLLVTAILGPVALGIYDVASRICSSAFGIVGAVISDITLPIFSKLQDNKQKARAILRGVTFLLYIALIPMSILLILLAPYLVQLLFGDQWINAVPLVQIFALLGLAQPITHFWDQLIVAFGKPSWALMMGIAKAIAMTIAILVAIQWGVVAVAVVRVAVTFLFMPLSLYCTHKLLKK